jgi:hypothetical protein
MEFFMSSGVKEDAIDEAAAVAMGHEAGTLRVEEWCYVWFLDALNERGYDVVKSKKAKLRVPQKKQKRKHKTHVARTPGEVAKYKERFIEQLAAGCAPGVAARNIGISRRAAYNWKQDDEEFNAKWVDAVETSLDVLETSVYDRGLKDGVKTRVSFCVLDVVMCMAMSRASRHDPISFEHHTGRTSQAARTSWSADPSDRRRLRGR